MTAAVAAAPQRSARETFLTTFGKQSEIVNLDAPRFFVQFGWNKLEVDVDGVPNKSLLRGEITPLRSFAKRANYKEIPEGLRIPGSEEIDERSKDRTYTWARYWLHAHYEAERLIELEANAADKQGVFEITTLRDAPMLYTKYDLNAIFYPEGLFALPEKNADMVAHLEFRLAEIQRMTVEDKDSLLAIGRELLAAAQYNARIQEERLEWTHTRMKMEPSDPTGNFKRRYDGVDEEMLVRTGRPRIHQALDATANALEMLATRDAKSDTGGMNALVEQLRIQNEQQAEQLRRQNQIVEMLLVERQPAKPEAAKPEARSEPKKKAD